MEPFSHVYTDVVACPHCGYGEPELSSGCDYGEEVQCRECGKWFSWWEVESNPKYASEVICAPDEHRWEVYNRSSEPDKTGREYGTLKCSVCGKFKSVYFPLESI